MKKLTLPELAIALLRSTMLPLLLSLSFSLNPAQASERQTAATQRAKLAHFSQLLDQLRQQKRIPGLAFAVIRDGEILTATGLGVADVRTGRAVAATTPFNIASVSKTLSGVLAMQLVEQGKLDLDRPISEYSQWQDFCASFSKAPSIFARRLRCQYPHHTLRHLLSHTAELKPGTDFSYNPVVFSWASRPIMALTGESFSDLIEQKLLKPAGMTHSARIHRNRPLPAALAKTLAQPHKLDDENEVVPAAPPAPQGDGAAGGVIASVLDLARFDIALDKGLLLSKQAREQMWRSTPTQNGPAPYGIGWYVQQHNGESLIWHAGWWEDAYTALYLKVPERKLTFIALANSEGMWWGNPLDKAAIEESEFAQLFLKTFVSQ